MVKSRTSDENDKDQNFLESLQSSILRRITRTPISEEPIVYEFTQDRALLHQYYQLRESMYRKIFHTDKFVGEEDVHDKLSHIIIARRGKLCIGGCRLTIREGDEKFMLPMETQEFRLREIFPELPLSVLRHGEISRFAISDAEEDKLEVMRVLSNLIIEKAITSGLGHIFAKSTLAMARNWRMIGQSCGLKKTRICKEIKVPENPIHPEIEWYLSVSTLVTAENYENSFAAADLQEESAVH